MERMVVGDERLGEAPPRTRGCHLQETYDTADSGSHSMFAVDAQRVAKGGSLEPIAVGDERLEEAPPCTRGIQLSTTSDFADSGSHSMPVAEAEASSPVADAEASVILSPCPAEDGICVFSVWDPAA